MPVESPVDTEVDGGAAGEEVRAVGDALAANPTGSSTGRSAKGSKAGREAASIVFEPHPRRSILAVSCNAAAELPRRWLTNRQGHGYVVTRVTLCRPPMTIFGLQKSDAQPSIFPKRREAPLAPRSWQKSRLLPAGDGVGLRPANAGPNKRVTPIVGYYRLSLSRYSLEAQCSLIDCPFAKRLPLPLASSSWQAQQRLMLPQKTPRLRFTAQRSLGRYLLIFIDLSPEPQSPMQRASRVTQ